MMSETTHLKLFKHDNPETNKNLFDITKSLNENWNKIDEYVYNQEATRQENEDIRQINETKRQTNEENRQSQEEIRNSQEEMRQVNEKERKSNETQRETNEQAREEYIEQLKEQVINGEVGKNREL